MLAEKQVRVFVKFRTPASASSLTKRHCISNGNDEKGI